MPLEFQLVPCPKCEGTDFLTVHKLKQKAGAGLITDTTGYACLSCQTVVDTQSALHAMTLRQKREELRLLEEELGVTRG